MSDQPASARLPARTSEQEGWSILHLEEASLMDPAVIEALGAHVEGLLAEGRRWIILDFRQVQYISSSMIGVLVGSRQSVQRAGGQLVIANLNQRLGQLLKITRLDKMFIVEPDVPTAVERHRAG